MYESMGTFLVETKDHEIHLLCDSSQEVYLLLYEQEQPSESVLILLQELKVDERIERKLEQLVFLH